MEPPRLPQAARQVVFLAYTQQVENIREAKRLQWHMTYLGVGALVALGGSYQLLRQWAPTEAQLAGRVLAVLGGVVAVGACLVIETASQAMTMHPGSLSRTSRSALASRWTMDAVVLSHAPCSSPSAVLTWVLTASLAGGALALVLTSALAASLIATCMQGCVWW